MKNQIIINAKGNETRIALIENQELSQFFVESPEVVRTVGDIYLAEVHKVMGGIRAAFIDTGLQKDAFLHFSDVGEHLIDYVSWLNGKSALDHVSPDLIRKIKAEQQKNPEDDDTSGSDKQGRAADILRTGQKVLVQIVKEPMGSKGPRVSTDISLAGRFIVLIPFGNYVAVSKRIRSHKERRRLRSLVGNLLPGNFGLIVRTVAGGQPDEIILQDLQDLLDKWKAIEEKIPTAKPPALLHRDLDMTESLIRDLFAKDYDRILIDDPSMFKSIRTYVQKIAPQLLPNIKAYKGKEHIFDHMKIAADVESIYTPRVKMKSGGYLIFEQTEAMYVIDVNSGRYAAKKNQEENSLKTNLEAARELAKQLRLRDIGGIIVVDFIDLKDDGNRKKVYDELKKEFRKDKAKTNVLPMSDFGLIQITRQRIRPSINSSISKVCPMCGGSGDIVSQNTIITDVDAWITKFRHLYKYRSVDLYVNPYFRGFLTKGIFSKRLQWMLRYWLKISIYADETISMNDFKFTLQGSDVDITDAVLSDLPIELAIKQGEEANFNNRRDPSKLDIYGKENDTSVWEGVDEDGDADDDAYGQSGHDRNQNKYNDDREYQNERRETRETKNPRENGTPRDARPPRPHLEPRPEQMNEPVAENDVEAPQPSKREPRPPRPPRPQLEPRPANYVRPDYPTLEELAAREASEKAAAEAARIAAGGEPAVVETPQAETASAETSTKTVDVESTSAVHVETDLAQEPQTTEEIDNLESENVVSTGKNKKYPPNRKKNLQAKYYKKPAEGAAESAQESVSDTTESENNDSNAPVTNPLQAIVGAIVDSANEKAEKPAVKSPKPVKKAKKLPFKKPAKGKKNSGDAPATSEEPSEPTEE